MLTEEETQAIQAEMVKYETFAAVCPEALRIVQENRRWVPDDAVADVAGLLDMTVEEVDAVATFYNLILRRPVGRHVIRICDSVSCWLMGFGEVLARIVDRLGISWGETTRDGRFTLLPAVCLGACDHAPAILVDEDLHQDLTPDRVDEVLDLYL